MFRLKFLLAMLITAFPITLLASSVAIPSDPTIPSSIAIPSGGSTTVSPNVDSNVAVPSYGGSGGTSGSISIITDPFAGAGGAGGVDGTSCPLLQEENLYENFYIDEDGVTHTSFIDNLFHRAFAGLPSLKYFALVDSAYAGQSFGNAYDLPQVKTLLTGMRIKNHQKVTYRVVTGSASYKTAVRNALDLWEAVGDLKFVETTDKCSLGSLLFFEVKEFADLPYRGVTLPVTAWELFGNTKAISVSVIATLQETNYSYGTNGFYILVHEIGHAIGLDHPGTGGGAIQAFSTKSLPAGEDNTDHSVMSYVGSSASAIADSPMPYDIAAVHSIYGSPDSGNPAKTYTISGDVALTTTLYDPSSKGTLKTTYSGTDLLNIVMPEMTDHTKEAATKVSKIGKARVIMYPYGSIRNISITGNPDKIVIKGNGYSNDIRTGDNSGLNKVNKEQCVVDPGSSESGSPDVIYSMAKGSDVIVINKGAKGKLEIIGFTNQKFLDRHNLTSSGDKILIHEDYGSLSDIIKNITYTQNGGLYDATIKVSDDYSIVIPSLSYKDDLTSKDFLSGDDAIVATYMQGRGFN